MRPREGGGAPLLGHVDPYDDTVFNEMQMPPLIRELQQLADTAPPAEAETARNLIALTDLVLRTPHLYLVFLGD
ncbi:MAG TPA: hypothetical protein VNQ77_02675 [Frankiaceae bacterium]|nr:hypothetical protein [Frankiaceae bacterium]